MDGKMKNCRLSLIGVRRGSGGVVLADKPKWRNWQTRYIQGVVPVREWRFESSLRHHGFDPSSRVWNCVSVPQSNLLTILRAAAFNLPSEARACR